MPNRHSPRQNKTTDLLLVDEVDQEYFEDRLNIVPNMDFNAKREALSYISERISTAEEQTSKMRTQMANSDKQYKGEWQSDSANPEEDIFLPMTREDINSVRAYLISILAQILPIVRMQPSGSGTIWPNLEIDIERAMLAQAMFDYYWKDQWHAIDDVMPRFLTHYLKYPMAVLKVGYYETSHDPDLMLEVVDRGFLYIDPRANTLHEAGWIGHEYYLPVSEVEFRVKRGDWYMTEQELAEIDTVAYSSAQSTDMQRFFGKNTSGTTLTEDEMVMCVDYWQFPRQGLADVYATVIGASDVITGLENGTLVRYGNNPFPVKGNPFIGGSFNPDDRPDGQSMAMLQEPFQKVANTLYNIRVADVKKNVRAASIVLEQMVDDQTITDLKNGNRIVRAAKTFNEFVMNNPGSKLGDFMADFPSGTSTGEILIQDMAFILSMGQKSSNTPDVFRGMNAQPGATLGQIQEQLSRTTGQFTPITRNVMRIIERVAQHTTAYFRSEEFYDEDRIIRIVGKNTYKNAIQGWHEADQNTAYKSVSADDVDVDMVFDAISGADMIASRTLLMTTFERVMGSLSQSPEIAADVRQQVNFGNYFRQIINVTGFDVEGIFYSDEEKAQNAQKEQQKIEQEMNMQRQQQQEQMQLQAQMAQMQAQIDMMKEQAKQDAMAKKQMTVDQAKGIMTADNKAEELELGSDLNIIEMGEQGRIDRANASHQGEVDRDNMDFEAELEKEAFDAGKDISVGRDSDNVEAGKKVETKP